MTRVSRRAPDDRGFAMVLALIMILVLASTSLVVARVLGAQQRPTLLARKYIRTINGAQAGMQNTLSALQSATTAGAGDPTKLPCSEPSDLTQYGGGGVSFYVTSATGTTTTINVPGDPVKGTVASDGNANDAINYNVGVIYYTLNPQLHQSDAAWLTANALDCKGGYVASVPSYALVQSAGIGARITGASTTSGDRTVQAIYQFLESTQIVVGGRIAEYTATPDTMCLDAGSPAVSGAVPTMQPCQPLGFGEQLWEYRNDQTIFYGGNPSLNLCLENVSGTPKLKTCTGDGTGAGNDTTYPYHSTEQQNQEWSFDDDGHFATVGSTGDVNLGACLQPNTPDDSTNAVSGTSVVVTSCSGNTTGTTAFNPDPQVGAGSALVYYSPTAVPTEIPPVGTPASSPTNQFVNFAEFGRCLDVTGQNVGADHLIDYPCKQAPNYCNLTWNQVWYYQAVSGAYGIFYTDYANGRSACDAVGTNYCLTEPTAPSTFITVTPCATTPPANQLWDATGAQATYSSAYLLKSDLDSRCMAADPSNQATFGSSTIVAAPCNDTNSVGPPAVTGAVPTATGAVKNPLLLKWNAPPSFQPSGLQNVHNAGPGTAQ
jgi:hypothetical protein